MTVALAQIEGQIRRMRPPRALYAEFPLGRPLGRPGDPAFQHRVLAAVFALLGSDEPVVETFGEVIVDEADAALACVLPPRLHDDRHPAADEALALRGAYERTRTANGGRTLVGRAVDADGVADAIEAFDRIAGGVEPDAAGLGERTVEVAQDVRAYYEEAALSLADHVPAARSTETWFFHHTEAGRVLVAARDVMQADGRPGGLWYGVVPMTQ